MLIERYWHELNGGWVPADAEGTQASPSLSTISGGRVPAKLADDGPRDTHSILRRGALVAVGCPLIRAGRRHQALRGASVSFVKAPVSPS